MFSETRKISDSSSTNINLNKSQPSNRLFSSESLPNRDNFTKHKVSIPHNQSIQRPNTALHNQNNNSSERNKLIDEVQETMTNIKIQKSGGSILLDNY